VCDRLREAGHETVSPRFTGLVPILTSRHQAGPGSLQNVDGAGERRGGTVDSGSWRDCPRARPRHRRIECVAHAPLRHRPSEWSKEMADLFGVPVTNLLASSISG